MPQRKIDFFGQLRPTGADQTGAQRVRALAGLAGQAGEIATQIGTKIRRKEGELAGAKAVERDDSGEIVAPELESDLTVFGESFNRAAVAAYRAQIGLDAREDLDRIQEENKLDPEAFKAQVQSFKQKTLENMPEEIANIVGLDIDNSASQRLSTLNKSFFARELRKQQATVVQSVEAGVDDVLNAVRSGDDVLVNELISSNSKKLNDFVELGLIDPIKAENIKEQTKERMAQQDALNRIEQVVFNEDLSLEQILEKGEEFISELREKEIKDLSPEQKDSLIKVVESKIKDVAIRKSSEVRQRDIKKEKLISNLRVQSNLLKDRAMRGESVDMSKMVEITENLHSSGDIKTTERTSILTQISKAQDEIEKITLADKRILSRLDGDTSITMNKGDVNSFYERNIQDDIEKMTPEMKSVAQANFISKARFVPSKISGQIQNNILSGNPELIKQSADLISRIDEIPGLIELAVTPNQRAFVDQVNSLSESLSPEEAVILAKEITNPKDKNRVEAKSNEIKEEGYEEDYEDVVRNSFETFFGTDLLKTGVNKENVEAEYKSLFESFFKNGMSKNRAEEKALEILHTNWKDSQFGFMKYRPEDYYRVGDNTDYIKDQLTKDITVGFAGFEFNKDNIFLFSDDETARKAGQGRPDYKIMVIDNNGEFQRLPGRWAPDVEAEKNKQLQKNKELFEGRVESQKIESKGARERLDRLSEFGAL